MALDALPDDRIDHLDDGSLQAEKCVTAYQPALELLLEDHDYDFAVHREALAETANDRSSEWAHAYALPDMLARPRYVLPSEDGAVLLRSYGGLPSYDVAVPYRISGGKLYTDTAAAVLDFITNAPSENRFTAKFARALALELACRIVMPLKKSSKREAELIRMAEVARDRAKADDMNRDPDEQIEYVPAVQAARIGWPMGYGNGGRR